MRERSKSIGEDPEVTRISISSYDGKTYARKYNNYLFEKFSDRIRGDILDIGAQERMAEKYLNNAADDGQYIALDLSPELGVDIRADGTKLPIATGSIDTVILSEVLEHVSPIDFDDLLSEVHRVLREDGIVVAVTPFIYRLHGVPHDHSRLTPYGLLGIFERTGFDAEVYCGGSYPEAVLSLLQSPANYARVCCGRKWPSQLFGLVHFPVFYFGVLVSSLISMIPANTKIGKHLHDVRASNNAWIVTQMVIAHPRTAEGT